ncbi:hypothetical protein RRG08_057193 [Elysia crispata]|uniref:Uncharacterized protein n=1 Tax=Elysia crispata TaxID=231223 RepID=A0AAE1CNN2_9GAST|nr:hypothetical protein RRG08_057193 [Elysia crispata]
MSSSKQTWSFGHLGVHEMLDQVIRVMVFGLAIVRLSGSAMGSIPRLMAQQTGNGRELVTTNQRLRFFKPCVTNIVRIVCDDCEDLIENKLSESLQRKAYVMDLFYPHPRVCYLCLLNFLLQSFSGYIRRKLYSHRQSQGRYQQEADLMQDYMGRGVTFNNLNLVLSVRPIGETD